jgi:zinc/manganese transport system ATP-binding protein
VSTAIRLTDVTVCYDRHPAVHHLSGEFESGSLTAIAGPNGGGKSTLLRALVGLVRVDQGQIDRQRSPVPLRLAWLAQQARLDALFPLTVAEVAAMGLWPELGSWRALRRQSRERIDEALHAVGLLSLAQRPLGSLSAGQLQRTLFARLLLQDADILLLDEPFNALDPATTLDLLALVQRWHSDSRTVIVVLHDLVQIAREFPRTLLLAREMIAWGATADVLTSENLGRAGMMTEGWRDAAPVCARTYQ